MTAGRWRIVLMVILLLAVAGAMAPRWRQMMTQPHRAQADAPPRAPQSGDDWARLGDTLMREDRYPQALLAYRQALALRGGDARLYAALGVALYYQNGQRLTPEVQQWLDSALAVDPNEVTALMLLASDAFLRTDYRQAIALWQRVLDTPSPWVNRQRVIEAIAMAQRLSGDAP